MKRQLRATLFALRHLGLLGWVGVMLALSTIAYAAIFVPQRDAEIFRASAEISRLQQRLVAMENGDGTTAVQGPSLGILPTAKTTPEALLTLEDIGRQDKLQLKRSDYHYVDPTPPTATKGTTVIADQNRLLEVRIAMPASGSYANIRAFIAHAMEKLPTLALNEISLKREAIAGGDLQAQLRFSLFVRGGS